MLLEDASVAFVPVNSMMGGTPPGARQSRAAQAENGRARAAAGAAGMAGAIGGAVRSRKEPANEYGLTAAPGGSGAVRLRVDRADDLEFIRGRLAKVPEGSRLGRARRPRGRRGFHNFRETDAWALADAAPASRQPGTFWCGRRAAVCTASERDRGSRASQMPGRVSRGSPRACGCAQRVGSGRSQLCV